MVEEILRVKMRNNKIEVVIRKDSEYEIIKSQLFKKLDGLSHFLTKGCPNVIIAGKEFSEGQKREISSIIKTDYNVRDVNFCTVERLEQLHKSQEIIALESGVKDTAKTSVFKMGRVDNGTVLEAKGDMTIIGDVDFGAKIVAGGNICVLGALRGEAYAGAQGDEDAIIVASVFEPKKLRIADCVGIAPKDNKSIGAPEYAHIDDGNIIIEPVHEDNAFDNDERQRGIIGSIKRFFTYDH